LKFKKILQGVTELVPDKLNSCTMGKDFLTANSANFSNYAN